MANKANETTLDTKEETIDFIPMVLDDVCDYIYTKAFFEQGIDEGSYIAGIFTGLINSGIKYNDAIEILKILAQQEIK